MSEHKPLEQVLSDLRDEAKILGYHGDARTEKVIDDIVDRVKSSAEDYISWVSESQAQLRSGRAPAWFRKRFAEWAEAGHARLNAKKQREYRLVVVPRRANVSAAREAGRRGEKRSA